MQIYPKGNVPLNKFDEEELDNQFMEIASKINELLENNNPL